MKRFGLVIALAAMASFGYAPRSAHADFIFSVRVAPPPLPVYDQPVIPGPDFLWTPGYWSYDDDADDYYWVPGVWVRAPEPGLLWTPGYWAWRDGAYAYSEGYWGPRVGFYGGVAYGFGYTGVGFYGGRWRGNSFYYNRSVTNINTRIVQNNVYTQTVVVNNITKVSYNGGTGGTTVKPTQAEIDAAKAKTLNSTPDQTKHTRDAKTVSGSHASTNNGTPSVVATSKLATFTGPGVVGARPSGDASKSLNKNPVGTSGSGSGSQGNLAGQGDAKNKGAGKDNGAGKDKGTGKDKNGNPVVSSKTKDATATDGKSKNTDRDKTPDGSGKNTKSANTGARNGTASLNNKGASPKYPQIRNTAATGAPLHRPAGGPQPKVVKKPPPKHREEKKKQDERRG